MQREYRLTKDARFRQARAQGRSWPHPFLVLYALRNSLDVTRFGFSVSKRIGGAVVRNRVKRRLREAARQHRPHVEPGWDLVFIARSSIVDASFQEIVAAMLSLLRRAKLTTDPPST